MPQERLSNDEFLTKLNNLLSTTHASQHGSIFLVQKPLPSTNTNPADQPQILIRATNGATVPSRTKSKVPSSKITKTHTTKEKIKLATVINESEVEEFFVKYVDVCKKGMEGLRKRDKKKAKAKKKGKKTV